MANLHIKNDIHAPGHVHFVDDDGKRIDGCSGPRDFMVRAYIADGHRVFDHDGVELKWTRPEVTRAV